MASPILSFDSSTGSVVLRGDDGKPFQTNLSQIQSLKQSGALNPDGTVNMSVASGQDGAVPRPVPMQVDNSQGVPPPMLGSPSRPNSQPMQMLRPVPGVPVPPDQPIQPATGGAGEAGTSAPVMQQPPAQPAQHAGGMGGGYLNQYQQQTKQLMAAQDAQAQVGMNQAKAEADVQRQQMQEQESLHAEQQQAQADRQKHRDQLLQTYQRAANDFDQISTKVDPGQYAAGMNMPQKFLAILGIGLGAAGKGPNIAAEMVNKAIEQNIDAQKFQIQSALSKGKAKTEGAMNMLDFFQRSMNDDLLAEQATRKYLQDKFQKQLDTTAAQFKSPQVQANYQALKAQTGQQSAQTAQSMAATIDNVATQRALVESETRKNNAAAYKDLTAGDGKGGIKQMPAELAAKVGAIDAGLKRIDELKQSFGTKVSSGLGSSLTGMTQIIPGTDANQYNKMKDTVVDQMVNALREGNEPRETTIKRIEGLLPTAGTTSGNADLMFQQLRNALLANRDTLLKSQSSAGYDTSGFKSLSANPQGLSSLKKMGP